MQKQNNIPSKQKTSGGGDDQSQSLNNESIINKGKSAADELDDLIRKSEESTKSFSKSNCCGCC